MLFVPNGLDRFAQNVRQVRTLGSMESVPKVTQCVSTLTQLLAPV